MSPSLLFALMFMCAAGIGIVYWMYRITQSQIYIECVASDTNEKVIAITDDLYGHDEASRERQAELSGYVERSAKTVGKYIADNAVDEAKFTAGLKLQVASVRHDMAIDRLAIDDRFDALEKLIAEDGKKTRKDSQEIKTALRDDEKQQQQERV